MYLLTTAMHSIDDLVNTTAALSITATGREVSGDGWNGVAGRMYFA